MIFEHDVFVFVQLYVVAVDFFAVVLALAQSTDIKIVGQHFGDRDYAPAFLNLAAVFLACRFLARTLTHTRRGNVTVGKVIGDFFVAPALIVQTEHLAHHLGGRLVYLKGHFL